jgi:hypothetical protein
MNSYTFNFYNWLTKIASASALAITLGYPSLALATTNAIMPIKASGKAFINSENNSRFMLRGITYQPQQNIDPISDDKIDTIQKLIGTNSNPGLWKQLNINAIRVYQVQPELSHDKVMKLLQDNGIYVLVGASNTSVGVYTYQPKYTTEFKNRIRAVIDAFGKYPNTFGLNIGNEVEYPYVDTNDPSRSNTLANELNGSAAIKSAIRDAQQYIKAQVQSGKASHQILVGTAMLDNPNALQDQVGTNTIAQYFACESKDTDGTKVIADYVGINNSRYNGPNGNLNAYDYLIEDYNITQYSIPVMFTEFEAEANHGVRDWADVTHLFTTKSQYSQLSGGFAYRFFQKNENRGLINSPQNLTPTPNGGFTKLSQQYKNVSQIDLGLPPKPASTISCPSNFNPALVQAGGNTPISGDINIRVKNYTDKDLKVVQDSKQLATLTAKTGSTPTTTQVTVDSKQELFILLPEDNWPLVCSVKENKLKNNSVVMNNVSWGNSCNVN